MCSLVSKKDYFALTVFTFVALSFHVLDMVFITLDAHYYLVCAALDLVVIRLIASQVDLKDISLLLIGASLVSICLNFGGWVLYELYYTPVIYNVLFSIYYIAVLILIAIRSQRDGSTAAGHALQLRGNYQLWG